MEEKLAKAEAAADKSELAKEVSELRKLLSEKAEWFDGYNKGTDSKIQELMGRLDAFEQSLRSAGVTTERGMLHIDGMSLMQNMMTDKAIPVSEEMETYLRTVSENYQRGKIKLNRLKKGNVTWSPSTETDWRKTGGQGVIFSQQAKNFREVGVTEYEILAVNEIPKQGGIKRVRTELKIDDNKENIKEVIDELNQVLNKDPYTYSYSYKDKDIKLQKAVEFPVDTYHNGKHSLENVAVYLGEDFQTKQPVLMFENSRYFNSNQTMYGNSAGGITERERAAFIGTVMYKLEKLIRDPKSVTNCTIFNQEAFKSIKAPDAVYLHDASAAPYILAARLKAPLEAANGELSKEAADAISTKNIVAKFHNLDYRGEGYGEEKADILNTLLDKTVKALRQLDNPEVKKSLEKLYADGVTTLRQYVPYVHTDSTETIMNAKRQNKMMFVEQLRSMIKYNKESGTQLFKLSVPEDLNLDSINMGNIDDVMIASFGARLVEQKNIPMLTKALKEMYSEFESRYPGKKLITVIGGPDDTAAKDYHKMLSENIGKGNISQLEFTPNPIYQSASDFTLRTSEFEPDGDLAESLYKGTPVIVTRVGGYVDRIAGTNKGILARRTPAEVIDAKEDLLTGMTKDYKEALF